MMPCHAAASLAPAHIAHTCSGYESVKCCKIDQKCDMRYTQQPTCPRRTVRDHLYSYLKPEAEPCTRRAQPRVTGVLCRYRVWCLLNSTLRLGAGRGDLAHER